MTTLFEGEHLQVFNPAALEDPRTPPQAIFPGSQNTMSSPYKPSPMFLGTLPNPNTPDITILSYEEFIARISNAPPLPPSTAITPHYIGNSEISRKHRCETPHGKRRRPRRGPHRACRKATRRTPDRACRSKKSYN